MRARFARLYPLHFCLLTVVVVLHFFVFTDIAGSGGSFELADLPYHDLMLLGVGLVPLGWNYPAWSIGAEWWTYLSALPILRVLDHGLSWRTYVAIVLCLAGLLSFTLGICTHRFYRLPPERLRVVTSDAVVVLTILAMFLILHFAAPIPPAPDAPYFDSSGTSGMVFLGEISYSVSRSTGCSCSVAGTASASRPAR